LTVEEAVGGDPTSETKNPVEDAHVDSNSPSSNYGNNTKMVVYDYNDGREGAAYLKFDLSDMNSSGMVSSVTLRMNLKT